ncbi:MAG: SLBB domain-containing protein [Microcoleaceae cyanobacterium]
MGSLPNALESNPEIYAARWIVPSSDPLPPDEAAVLAPANTSQLEERQTGSGWADHWARSFIEPLVAKGIVPEFAETLDPEQPVTQGQFGTILENAFGVNPLAKSPDPDQEVLRVEALSILVQLLNLKAQQVQPEQLNRYFTDAAKIPNSELNAIAAAVENRLVVNYPNRRILNPQKTATVAEISAFVYQALVQSGRMPSLVTSSSSASNSPANPPSNPTQAQTLPRTSLANLPVPPPTQRPNSPPPQRPNATGRQATTLAIEIADNQDYTLGKGDRIQITLPTFPEHNGEYSVLVNGLINLPLLGKIRVDGMTLQQLERTLEAGYARTMKNPSVTVSLLATSPVDIAVAGEVSRPGAYAIPVDPSKFPTVSQAIQLAGGINQSANVREVEVRRSLGSGQEQTILVNLWDLFQNGELRQDLVLRDGDRIFIPTVSQTDLVESPQLVATNLYNHEERPLKVAIVGEVFRPGSYTLASGTTSGVLTVTRAIQEAGGITSTANLRNVQVRRSSRMGSEETVNLDLFALLQQGDLRQDLILENGDTIVIPTLTDLEGVDASAIVNNNLYSPESKPVKVAIVGEVSRPGPYTLTADSKAGGILTVTQAIQQAGGITSVADLRQIQVKRPGKNGEQEVINVNLFALLQQGDLRQDLILKDGDTVIIPTAEKPTPAEISELARSTLSPSTIRVNAVGEILRPGVIEVPPNTPLSQAVLAAGGFNNRANKGSVELIRLSPDGTVEKREIEVDFATGIGEENNPTLRNNDIIVVRPSGLAAFADDISPIMSIFAPFTTIFQFINRLF